MELLPQHEFDAAMKRARQATRRGDAIDAGRWVRLARQHLELLSHYRAAVEVEDRCAHRKLKIHRRLIAEGAISSSE